MEFYAHKREMPDGAIVTQTVREHLVGTAQRAAQCLRQVGLEHAGYLAGLLHDLGKYTEAFQQYLDEGDSTKRGSVSPDQPSVKAFPNLRLTRETRGAFMRRK